MPKQTRQQKLKDYLSRKIDKNISNIRDAYEYLGVQTAKDAYRKIRRMIEADTKQVVLVGLSFYKEDRNRTVGAGEIVRRSRRNGDNPSYYVGFKTKVPDRYIQRLDRKRSVAFGGAGYPTLMNILSGFDGFATFLRGVESFAVSPSIDEQFYIRIDELDVVPVDSERLNFMDAFAYDDSECVFLANRYISTSRELYIENSSPAKLKKSCWLNLLCDVYKGPIEAVNKKLKVTRLFIHGILDPEGRIKSEGNGYSFHQVKKFFDRFQLALYVFDIENNIVAYSEPVKRNTNVTPEVLYVLFHNQHVFRFNNDLKSLEQKVKEYRDKMASICHKPNPRYYLKPVEENQTSYLVNNMEELLRVVETFELPAKQIRVLFNQPSCFELWLALYQMGIEASVTMTNGEACFKTISLFNHKCADGMKRSIFVYSLEEAGVYQHQTFDTQTAFNAHMNRRAYASNWLLTSTYLSQYHPNVREMLQMYMKSPLIGKFDPDINYRDSVGCIHLDFNKFYTSILQKLEMLPTVNSFDQFVEYRGEGIRDYNLYFVEKFGDSTEYPFHKYSLCFGRNIRGVRGVALQYVLNISRVAKNNAPEVIETVYRDKGLSVLSKKNILNHIVGCWNKRTNKKSVTRVFTDAKEARYYLETYGGRACKQKYVDQYGVTQVLHVNHIEDETELDEGFRLISLLVYDTAHKQLLDCKREVENCGLYVYGCNTDCLYVQKDLAKFSVLQKKFPEMFAFDDKNSFEAIGRVKVEMDAHFAMNNPMKRTSFDRSEDFVKPIRFQHPLEIRDEFSADQVSEILFENPQTLVTAVVAGAGKTTSLINFAKKYQLKTLIVAPYNPLVLDLRIKAAQTDGLIESITLDKFLGGRITDSGEEKNGAPYSLEGIDVVVFDEVFLYRLPQLMNVHGRMRACPEVRFYATGDEYQLRPVDTTKYYVPDTRQYFADIVNGLFANKIELQENKRCHSPEDRERMKQLSRDILHLEKMEDVWGIFEKYNIPVLPTFNTQKNLCSTNELCAWVNDSVVKHVWKGKMYEVDHPLISRARLHVGKRVVFLNYTYTIQAVSEDKITLWDGLEEPITLPRATVEKNFRAPFARTCNAYQGMSEDEPMTIFGVGDRFVDKYWVYTAVTRATQLKYLRVFRPRQRTKQELSDARIASNIAQHHSRDAAKFEQKTFYDYVTVKWIKEQIADVQGRCALCHEMFDGSGVDSWSIGRKDNDLPHVKMNCQIICRRCNVAKK